MALSFEIFEEKAIEAKKLLHSVYVELETFKREYDDSSPMDFVQRFGIERGIQNKAYNCSVYLKYFNEGNFENCERLINSGWAKKDE